jgi:hypothetical protein
MNAHRQAYDINKGGPALQFIVEGAYFNDHDEPKDRPFDVMRDMVEGAGYLDFAVPAKKPQWFGKEHILKNVQLSAKLSKQSAQRRSLTPEPGNFSKLSSHINDFTRSPSRLGNDMSLLSNQNFASAVLSRTHQNPVNSPTPGLPSLVAVKRFGLQADMHK